MLWRRERQPTPVFWPGEPTDRAACWAVVRGQQGRADGETGALASLSVPPAPPAACHSAPHSVYDADFMRPLPSVLFSFCVHSTAQGLPYGMDLEP